MRQPGTEEKIRYIIARCRNIVYYRLTVEEALWEQRFRCQYIHVIRDLRKDILSFIDDVEDSDPRKAFLMKVADSINPKVKSDECLDVIKNLKRLIEENEQ